MLSSSSLASRARCGGLAADHHHHRRFPMVTRIVPRESLLELSQNAPWLSGSDAFWTNPSRCCRPFICMRRSTPTSLPGGRTELRPETAADVSAIQAVTIAAFQHATHSSHTEQLIVASLRQAGRLTVSLVATDDEIVVGHIAISPVAISDGSSGWYGLGPLSVAPQYQRRGIGSHLTRAALSDLREAGASGCVVLGEPGYYGRFGFRATPRLTLPNVPIEYFQALSFGGYQPRGTVCYHASFHLPTGELP